MDTRRAFQRCVKMLESRGDDQHRKWHRQNAVRENQAEIAPDEIKLRKEKEESKSHNDSGNDDRRDHQGIDDALPEESRPS